MAKLWHKNYELEKTTERFTVGDDPLTDRSLIEADVLGSIAHARMLSEIGVLTPEEFSRLRPVLTEVLTLAQEGKFSIKVEQEDVHTAVEEFLTGRLGDLGKKIHTARSRNDQAALDVRLFARKRILDVADGTVKLAGTLLSFAERHKDVPMVGRTHTQRAMPSSVGLWSSAFAEALIEDLELLMPVYDQVNRSPLGSAASYGVALPIRRERAAELLGMTPVVNVLYANNTRGKIEATLLFALTQVMQDLARLSNDLILFSIPEFGYFTLPDKYFPGSSIMPQKKNPCGLELARAKASIVQGHLFALLGMTHALPSGYNRDLQETKGPLVKSLEITADTLAVLDRIFTDLSVNVEKCLKAFSPDVFAADAANELVEKGIPFRDAYKQIGLNLGSLKDRDPVENIRSKTLLGGPGNLRLDLLLTRLDRLTELVTAHHSHVEKVKQTLLAL